MPHYDVDNNLSKAQGVNSDLNWLVINHFCEPVDDDEDRVVTVSLPIR